jgi:integrase
MSFGDLTPFVMDEFTVWAKKQQYRKKPASNKTINKVLIPLKMICKQAAIKFNWGTNFNPFFGFKKLPEKTGSYNIEPFSLEEQENIIRFLPQHWKPYFQFALCSGLRQGEQFAMTVDDIDWRQGTISITKAMTLDESGSRTMGSTKNQYSRRVIKMSAVMKKVLDEQVKICSRLQNKYLFCTTKGNQLNHANLCKRVWTPALQRANIPYRPMIQTRHSFATTALSLGENPLWIARTMGHRDTDMVIRVYTKYVSNAGNHFDGNAVSEALMNTIVNN